MSHLNPYAFPSEGNAIELRSGMTLRDYFAAKALQGFLTYIEPYAVRGEGLPMAYAKEAYVYADAMLKARQE